MRQIALLPISFLLLASIILGSGVSLGATSIDQQSSSYILVGGQYGRWFTLDQSPRLYKISLTNHSMSEFDVGTDSGAVWSGGWNGSNWLVSGWGHFANYSSDPFIDGYTDGQSNVSNYLNLYASEESWHGGDVFDMGWNGTTWLLSGLGSDAINYSGSRSNHMSLATFNDSDFQDLSGHIPKQEDYILYANAWNGKYWLVGGGYLGKGRLFMYNGSVLTDLNSSIIRAVPSFRSVQSIAWNGQYWLIGGIGFLARFDGSHFIDLTAQLNSALNSSNPLSSRNAVNSIAWGGKYWLLGGGAPVAIVSLTSKAWFASYEEVNSQFKDLTKSLPTNVSAAHVSSVLSLAYAGDSWAIGGYENTSGMLLLFNGSDVDDLSPLIQNQTTYIHWVGAPIDPSPSNHTISSTIPTTSSKQTSSSIHTSTSSSIHTSTSHTTSSSTHTTASHSTSTKTSSETTIGSASSSSQRIIFYSSSQFSEDSNGEWVWALIASAVIVLVVVFGFSYRGRNLEHSRSE